MILGVIADTHIPQAQSALPARIHEVFRGVDIIIHAGDVCTLPVLRELQNSFAITMAVMGEADDEDVRRYVQPQHVLEFSGRRIGLIHGNLPTPTSLWQRIRARLWPRAEDITQATVRSAFSGVDCIIYGHTHRSCNRMEDGVLLFNPGPAAPVDGQRPSVGRFTVTQTVLSAEIIYLDE